MRACQENRFVFSIFCFFLMLSILNILKLYFICPVTRYLGADFE